MAGGATVWAWHYVEIDNARPSVSFGIDAADLSGDGYADIVSGRYFYRSPGSNLQGAWVRVEFPVQADAIAALDVDSDDRGDVIAVSCSGVFWIEANDRAGDSWTFQSVNPHSFCDHGIGAQGYCRAQVVAGGREEVVVVEGGDVHCIEIPANPSAGNWPVTVIAGNAPSDGVAGAESPIYWMENTGAGATWAQHTVGVSAMQLSMNAADMDNDGDADIVAAEGIGRERVQVWENSGSGTFTAYTVDEGRQNHTGTILVDFDNDGDRDIASESYTEPNYMFLWRNELQRSTAASSLPTGDRGAKRPGAAPQEPVSLLGRVVACDAAVALRLRK
jgi:hypothetical protein